MDPAWSWILISDRSCLGECDGQRLYTREGEVRTMLHMTPLSFSFCGGPFCRCIVYLVFINLHGRLTLACRGTGPCRLVQCTGCSRDMLGVWDWKVVLNEDHAAKGCAKEESCVLVYVDDSHSHDTLSHVYRSYLNVCLFVLTPLFLPPHVCLHAFSPCSLQSPRVISLMITRAWGVHAYS